MGPITEREPLRKIVNYDIAFDTANYVALETLRDRPQEHERTKGELDLYIKEQLRTDLGERFNVLLSVGQHEIQDGFMVFGGERLIDIFIRGRDYRRKNGQMVDWPREAAEVEGFEEINRVLCDPKTSVGTMMLSISPPGNPGTVYKKNFYDIFTLMGKDGVRYVEARRYSSALARDEYKQKLETLDTQYRGNFTPTDDYFLLHPVRIEQALYDIGNPAEIVHRYFHRGHDYMSVEDFSVIVRGCGQFMNAYIAALSENPRDVARLTGIYNALLNRADEVHEVMRRGGIMVIEGTGVPVSVAITSSFLLEREIDRLSQFPVREVAGGCGPSGSSREKGVFSVSEFGFKKDSFTCEDCGRSSVDNHYHCPSCKRDYADESQRKGEDRTKQCNCGLAFGC